MNGRQAHRAGTFVLSLAMVVIGLALLVQVAVGAGSGAGRVLLGVLFLAAGTGRLYVEVRRGRA
jgi:hypothetical protein